MDREEYRLKCSHLTGNKCDWNYPTLGNMCAVTILGISQKQRCNHMKRYDRIQEQLKNEDKL